MAVTLGKILSLLFLVPPVMADPAPAVIQVSGNHRFLVTGEGKPFFYLGDTAWELFHRLNREEVDGYLTHRASLGFNVIQAVALAELDGLNTPNSYGHRPLIDSDPAKPDVKDGPNNDYWDHVDYIVGKANSLGLVIGFLPTWGDKWNLNGKTGPEVFTPENARVYGEWIGHRYKDASVIWITGGDRAILNDTHLAIIRAMAEGLRKGDGGKHLITFHPHGGGGSAEKLHQEAWLDFNMRQNGHTLEYNDRYPKIRETYDLQPPKPVMDGEPVYEDHPASFSAPKQGHTVAADVRRAFYWDVFSGACGHTYGHHSVWQMWTKDRAGINNPLMPWDEALHQAGAAHMAHGMNLMLSRPYLGRIPDDSLIVTSGVPTSVPGAGTRRFVATRDQSGSYAMVYVPVGRKFSVDLDKVSGPRVNAWWFNPRTGKGESMRPLQEKGIQEFQSPTPGELLDWVLVLDDASKNYPPPGDAKGR